jgi:hypothetical protein
MIVETSDYSIGKINENGEMSVNVHGFDRVINNEDYNNLFNVFVKDKFEGIESYAS